MRRAEEAVVDVPPIRDDAALERAFARLEQLWNAPEGSPQALEIEALVRQIQRYEDRHYPIGGDQSSRVWSTNDARS